MTLEAQQALQAMGIETRGHTSRPISKQMIDHAERIYCMTEAHLNAIVQFAPEAASKTQLLDPESDIVDPIGMDRNTYLQCAQRIEQCIRQRLGHADKM